jgi:hypothetical protein
VRVRVEDLDARGEVDVASGDLAGAGDHERSLDLGGVRVHTAHDALEVEHDVRDVLGDALDRRELVGDTLDAHGGHRGAGERGQEHAAQRVAKGVAEAAIERLHHELAAVVLDGLGGDSGDLEVEHLVLTSSQVRGATEGKRRLGRRAPDKTWPTSNTARR